MRARWMVAGALVAVAIGVGMSWPTWRATWEQRARAEAARAEMKELEAQRAELLRERARLESPTGREEEARRMGLRRPEERPLDVGP